MATKAKAAKGTKLQRGDGATTEAFRTIAEVTTFSGPNMTAEAIEATSFDSAAAEFVAGLMNAGEIQFDLNFVGSDPEQQGILTDLRSDNDARNYKLVFNDHDILPTTISFSAIVTAFSVTGQGPSAAYKGSCTLKITGLPTAVYRP